MNEKIFLLVLISFFLLPFVFGAQVNAPVAAVSDVVWVEENYSMVQEATDAASSGSIEVDQTVAGSFQGNLTGTIQGGGQMLQFSSGSNSASFSQHIMCKDFELVPSIPPRYKPIDPTTIFRPSDTKAVVLTTVSVDGSIEFRWHYRNDSDKTWVYAPIPLRDRAWNFTLPGTYHWVAWFSISGFWPGYYYPRAYKVDVYLDDSPLPSFSEFFEVTNGGLNSPRMCEGIDVNGDPVNMTSRFTIDVDEKAYHYLRFDKNAYFNNETGYSHNFTTVWIQPNSSTYQTYSDSFSDYKNTNVTWNYWEYNYTSNDYIIINSSTPVGNWKVEVYLDSYFNNTWMPYGPIATTQFIVGNETVADWTFMVYLDADINIEAAGIDIFEKMANVSSSSRTNIVVQMDRIPGYDDRYGNWTDTKRFNVTKDMTPTPENAIMNLTEVNMGHPDTLKDFVNWTINNYPANYYVLVIWDHGTGFVGISYDFTTGPPIDFLTPPELSQALNGLPAIMDIVFNDACSMNMIEIAYQIKDYANLLVGPEGLGYSPAPYDDYLSDLISNSSISPSEFARKVVTHYMNWTKLTPIGYIPNATMSAVDLTRLTSLMAATEDFALKLKEKETLYHNQISLARNQTARYIGPYANQSGYYIDLYHFAQLTYQNVIDEELQNTADQVMTTLESIIIIEDNKAHPNSHGLSIFFPDEKRKYENYGSEYEETTFAKDNPWDEFVIYHLDIQAFGYVLTIQTPYPYIPVNVNETSKATDAEGKIQVFALLDQSYDISVPTLVETGPSSRGNFTRWDNDETNSSRTITVIGSTTYTAYYETQYEITFSQSGVGSDFTETVATINEKEYNATNLPVSFWWDNGTTHTFAFQSPLVVTSNVKQYVWDSTSGLSTLQSDSITVSTSGSVIGNYKTQYYLTLATSPPGVTTPPGEGWYYNGTDAPMSTDEFVDITSGASRYRFDGWTTTDMTKISDQNSPSTTIRMDKAKTVTANYVTQYYLTVISSDSSLTPTSGWFDSGTPINASVASPWSLGATDTRYVCTGWTGTGSVSMSGTTTSVTFRVDEPSNITWNWETQYLLTVHTYPTGLDPQPNVFPPGPWYDNYALVTCAAQGISGRVFTHWTVDGRSWDPGVNQIPVTMDGPHEVTAHYVHAPTWWEILFSVDMVNIYIGIVGFVAIPFALIGIGWVMTRRKRIATKALLNKIDEVYSKSKMSPRKCEEELCRLRNTILESMTDGKITQESYDLMNKRIDEYLEELRKQ